MEGLKKRGHEVSEKRQRSAVYAISAEADGFLYANADHRKGGGVAGIDHYTTDF